MKKKRKNRMETKSTCQTVKVQYYFVHNSRKKTVALGVIVPVVVVDDAVVDVGVVVAVVVVKEVTAG